MNTKYKKVSVAGFFFAGLFTLSSFSASPVITWDTQNIDTQIFQGGIRTFDVSVTSSKDIEDAEIRIVPAFEQFVTIVPNTFNIIEAGEPQTITITISVSPETPLGTLDGVIQIMSTETKSIVDKFIGIFKGKSTKETIFAKPLPVEFEVISAEGVLELVEEFLIDEFGTLTPPIEPMGDRPASLELPQELLDAFSLGTDDEVALFTIGSLLFRGLWKQNEPAKEGLSDLLNKLGLRGVLVDQLRLVLDDNGKGHDLHTELTEEARFLAITPGEEAIWFPPQSLISYDQDENGILDAVVMTIDNDTHVLHKSGDMENLIAKDHFDGSALKKSAATVMHELFHSLVFRTECFVGSVDAEENIAAAFEAILEGTVLGTTPRAELQFAIDNGGGPCLDLVGLLPPPTGLFAYVVNSGTADISVIDLAEDIVTDTFSVGGIPQAVTISDVAISPDGQRAYVTSLADNSVEVIDTETNTVITTIPVGNRPSGVAITPNGQRVFAVNTGASSDFNNDTVSVINTATNSVIATITVGEFPGDVAITPDGTKAFVNNARSQDVSVISVAANQVIETIPLAATPQSIIFSPDSQTVYIGTNQVVVLDLVTRVRTFIPIAVSASIIDLAITSNGSKVYAVNSSVTGKVAVIRTFDNQVIDTITIPSAPRAIAITPNDTKAYVTFGFSPGFVAVVDLIQNQVIDTISVGTAPADIDIAQRLE